jgi:hypothetical protein
MEPRDVPAGERVARAAGVPAAEAVAHSGAARLRGDGPSGPVAEPPARAAAPDADATAAARRAAPVRARRPAPRATPAAPPPLPEVVVEIGPIQLVPAANRRTQAEQAAPPLPTPLDVYLNDRRRA